jgi:peptidoglycan/xylan/chitin deacetylase (PgdA/CDA1 family)
MSAELGIRDGRSTEFRENVSTPRVLPDSTSANFRHTWRDFVIKALYHSRAVYTMERVTRRWELRKEPSASWPRLRRRRAPQFAILCYHRIGIGGVPLYSELSSDAFEAQMRYVRENYRIVSMDQLIAEMEHPESLEPALAITFDDGYRGLYEEAFPILQKHAIPATIFLTIGCIETGEVAWYDRVFVALKFMPGNTLELLLDRPRTFTLGSEAQRMWAATEIISCLRRFSSTRRKECCADLESKSHLPEDDLQGRMLTWDQIRIMYQGGVSFGAHTMSHPVVSQLSSSELDWEIFESKRILEERLGSDVRHFAFPFGKTQECGEPAIAVLAAAGFVSAATTEWGVNSVGSNPFKLLRLQIGEVKSLAGFAFQLNRAFFRYDVDQVAPSSHNSVASGAPLRDQNWTMR